jgi:GT2 family glycosyltransferase
MNPEKVNIIVLNYNNYQDTIECIDSILKLNYSNYNLILIDNASTNDSFDHLNDHLEYLKDKSPQYNYQLIEDKENDNLDDKVHIYLIKSNENKGYASGNNIGIDISMRCTNCEYFWILNNDTVVDSESLTNQVNYFNSELLQGINLGILGSKLLHYNDKNKIQAIAGSYDEIRGNTSHIGSNKNINEISQIESDKIDYVIGASMLVSRNFIFNVGFLSTEYFLYFEELDWALRAKAKKFSLGYCNDSLIYHKGGASVHYHESNTNGEINSFNSINSITEYNYVKSKLIYTHKRSKKIKKNIFIYINILIYILYNVKKGQFKYAYIILNAIYDFLTEKRELKYSK